MACYQLLLLLFADTVTLPNFLHTCVLSSYDDFVLDSGAEVCRDNVLFFAFPSGLAFLLAPNKILLPFLMSISVS